MQDKTRCLRTVSISLSVDNNSSKSCRFSLNSSGDRLPDHIPADGANRGPEPPVPVRTATRFDSCPNNNRTSMDFHNFSLASSIQSKCNHIWQLRDHRCQIWLLKLVGAFLLICPRVRQSMSQTDIPTIRPRSMLSASALLLPAPSVSY